MPSLRVGVALILACLIRPHLAVAIMMQLHVLFVAALAVLGVTLPGQPRAKVSWKGVPELAQRNSHAMAYDPARKRVVLFGGTIGNLVSPRLMRDTWEWDGTRWIKLQPPTSPPGRAQHAMAYDPVRQTVLMHGGNDSRNQPVPHGCGHP